MRLTPGCIGRAKDFHYHSNGLYFLENSEGDDEEEAAGSTEDDESTLVGSEEESSKYTIEWSLAGLLTLQAGESIYVCNKVELGQGRVPVTFIPYKEEWITHRVYGTY